MCCAQPRLKSKSALAVTKRDCASPSSWRYGRGLACCSGVLSGCDLQRDLVGARVATDGTLRLDDIGMTFWVWWLLVVLTLVEAYHYRSPSFLTFLSLSLTLPVHSFHLVFLPLSVSARHARVEKSDNRLSRTEEAHCAVRQWRLRRWWKWQALQDRENALVWKIKQ